MRSRFAPRLVSFIALALAAGCGGTEDAGLAPEAGGASSTVSQALGVCDGVTCGGHGVCRDNAGSAECACDEGFTGPSCATRGSNFYARTLLVPGLADPDVYKENDDLFFLTGTGDARTVPIYETNDLSSFRFKRGYDPSVADPTYDYCMIWAPDLGKANGVYNLYFSGQRVPNGMACPASGQDVTTFVASASDLNLDFGAPRPINPSTTYPRTTIGSACTAQGCNRNIRIDSATFNDTSGSWLFYVWLQNGNNLSSFNLAAPATVYNHTGPALYSLPAHEEGINEAPELLKRNGLYYLFFSTGWYDSQYAMSYIMGDSLPALTRARAVRPLSQAMRNASGALIQSHGHNVVVFYSNNGTWGPFVEKAYDGVSDDVFLELPGGTTPFVDLTWSEEETGAQYSIDVQRRDTGAWIGPCIGVTSVNRALAWTYSGRCDTPGINVAISNISNFRICTAMNGDWAHARCGATAYDGKSMHVPIVIP